MPPTYLRVKDKDTGAHYSEISSVVEANPDAYQVLKQPAVNANGDPLPGEIPETTGQTATTSKKENS